MKTTLQIAAAAAALLFAALAFADDDYEHYKGEPSKTLEQAVANLSEYNNRLEKVLAGELTPEAMNEVHQLTYTLENALQKINEEAADLTDILEEVHLASESNQPAVVKERGEAYLAVSRTLIP